MNSIRFGYKSKKKEDEEEEANPFCACVSDACLNKKNDDGETTQKPHRC